MKHDLKKFINQKDLYPKELNTNKTDDDKICILVFANCHNKYPLDKLGSKE